MFSSRLLSKNSLNLKTLIKFNYFGFSKTVPIKLPDLGEGTKEATIKTWFKKEGDLIEEEEKVVEVYTDKLVAEIPSPAKGKIQKINYKLEEACLVGKSLCEIEIEEEDDNKSKNSNQSDLNHSKKNQSNTSGLDLGLDDILKAEENQEPIEFGEHKTTPAVRHLLKQHNIKPVLIVPTGKGNRITKEDVINYIQNGNKQEAPKPVEKKHEPHKTEKTSGQISTPSSKQLKSKSKQSLKSLDSDNTIKIVGFQKAMTKSMSKSTSIPSFLYTDEFNVDRLVKLRKEMNKIDEGKTKFTYMPYFIKAVSYALLQFPQLNSVVNQELGEDGFIYEYTIKKDHNISIAIDSPEGLVVPNIKRVQDKSLNDIQRELYELRDKTLSKTLTSDDLRDGSFTISNIGNIGGKVLSPVIMPPQTCIIGISKMFDSVHVMPADSEYEHSQAYHLVEKKDLAVIFHKAVNLCISADHRIIDGATVARFSEVLKTYIENPLKIWIGN